MKNNRPLLALALLAVAGCTSTPRDAERAAAADAQVAASLEAELAGLAPRRRSACLPVTGRGPIPSTSFGATVVFRQSRDVKFRNDADGRCGGPNDILVTRTPQVRLCRGDIVQLIDRASRFPLGSCTLGEFVEYRRP